MTWDTSFSLRFETYQDRTLSTKEAQQQRWHSRKGCREKCVGSRRVILLTSSDFLKSFPHPGTWQPREGYLISGSSHMKCKALPLPVRLCLYDPLMTPILPLTPSCAESVEPLVNIRIVYPASLEAKRLSLSCTPRTDENASPESSLNSSQSNFKPSATVHPSRHSDPSREGQTCLSKTSAEPEMPTAMKRAFKRPGLKDAPRQSLHLTRA